MLLPLVLLMILALGWFTKAEGTWETCFHGAIDESAYSASMAADGVSGKAAGIRIRKRIRADADESADCRMRRFRTGFSDGTADELTSYSLETAATLDLPAGFDRVFVFSSRVKYRNFVGRKSTGDPLGADGLENALPENPVWIFPQSGEKYHVKNCSYVTASSSGVILTGHIRERFSPCRICRSGELPAGSLVYCFEESGGSYHRGSCRTIARHTAVIDRTEAIQKGYAPCSRCGGEN